MTPLTGKTFLVTGASSGIGAALCGQLLGQGANVLGVTRRPALLHPDVSPIVADLTSREDISAIFTQLGKIDGLVNCAGVAYLSRITDGNPADWEEMWRVNVLALSQTRAGMKMLEPEDVAQCIMTILTAPPHVEIGDILLRSSDQMA